jgi:hypothetical protein
MPDVSAVEFNYDLQQYVAIFTDGDTCVLTSDNLRDAEVEAERIADQSSFALFMPRQTYDGKE